MLVLLLISEFYVKIEKIYLIKTYNKFSYNPCNHFTWKRLFAHKISPKPTHWCKMSDFWRKSIPGENLLQLQNTSWN